MPEPIKTFNHGEIEVQVSPAFSADDDTLWEQMCEIEESVRNKLRMGEYVPEKVTIVKSDGKVLRVDQHFNVGGFRVVRKIRQA